MKVNRFSRIISFILGLGLVLACQEQREWVEFRGQHGQGATPTQIQPPLALKWKLKLQEKTEKATSFNPPIIMDDTIYFGSYDGNFYALDLHSGYMRWVFKTGGHINSIPTADKENVYFGSDDGKVYAVDRHSGKLKWSYSTGELVQSQIVCYQDMLVFVTNEGAVYFLDRKGHLLYTLPNYIWSMFTFQIYEDIMFFAPGGPSSEYGLSAFNVKKQNYLWEMDFNLLTGDWYSYAALVDDLLLMSVAAYHGDIYLFSFYALDRQSGKLRWLALDESKLDLYHYRGTAADLFLSYIELLDYMAPGVWGDLVIYTCGDTIVRAYRVSSGDLAWKKYFDYNTTSAPTIAGGRIYFGLDGNHLVEKSPGYVAPKLICLAAGDGRHLWETPIEGRILSAPVIAGRWIVFGTDEHIFYVMEEVF